MKSVVTLVVVATLALQPSCTPLCKSPLREQCKATDREFFRDTTKQEQIEVFSRLEIKKQYDVYVRGMEVSFSPNPEPVVS